MNFFFFFFYSFVQVQEGLQQVKPGLASQGCAADQPGLGTPAGKFIVSCYESSGNGDGFAGETWVALTPGMTPTGAVGDGLLFPLLLRLLQEREANREGNNCSI